MIAFEGCILCWGGGLDGFVSGNLVEEDISRLRWRRFETENSIDTVQPANLKFPPLLVKTHPNSIRTHIQPYPRYPNFPRCSADSRVCTAPLRCFSNQLRPRAAAYCTRCRYRPLLKATHWLQGQDLNISPS